MIFHADGFSVFLWIGGMLICFLICLCKWEGGFVYKSLPIIYGLLSGLIVAMLRGLDLANASEIILGFTLTGIVLSGIAWVDARQAKKQL